MTARLPGPETAGYRALLARLAGLDAAAAADRAEARAWCDGRIAEADAAVQLAAEEADAAEDEMRAAERARDEVDARAAQIWSDYVHTAGVSVERYGRRLPDPVVPRQRDREPDEYLREAAATTRSEAPARPLTGVTTVMFAAFGFMGGALGTAGQQLLRWAGRAAGGDWQRALPVIGLIVVLLGPVLALVAAKRVADRRGAGLDLTAVLTVLITGLFTAAVLYAVLRGAPPA